MISGPSNAIDVPAQGSETARKSVSQSGGRRRRTRVPASAPPELLSTNDVAAAVGLNPHLIQRWQIEGAITSTRPAAGTGSKAGWSPRDVAVLKAIAQVRADLAEIDPNTLHSRLWTDLQRWGEADIITDTVTISIRLGSDAA